MKAKFYASPSRDTTGEHDPITHTLPAARQARVMDHENEFVDEIVGLRAHLAELRNSLPGHRDGRYRNAFDLVVREGESFRSAALTIDEANIVKRAMGRKQFAPKLCFHNAQRLVLADVSGALEYVEGYTTDPIHHAWVAIGKKVVDVTLRTGKSHCPILGVFPGDSEYVGVRISRPYLVAARARGAVSLLDDWKRRFPILRDDPAMWRSGR